MKIICQIGVIFAVCWFSQLIEAALPVPFPASVIGMLLLLALLATGLLKIEHIREKADFLLANMAFFSCRRGERHQLLRCAGPLGRRAGVGLPALNGDHLRRHRPEHPVHPAPAGEEEVPCLSCLLPPFLASL